MTSKERVINRRKPLPARHPPTGAWPTLMRADTAAAYLDFQDAAQLSRAMSKGDAPRPTAIRGSGRSREPVWAKAHLDRFAEGADPDRATDLASLV